MKIKNWVLVFVLIGAVLPAGIGANETPADPIDPLLVIGAPEGLPRRGEELVVETDRVSAKMRCPVCQGLSVNDSPSESARAMKEEIRELLAEGYSEEQVLEYFERSYGEFVRLLPKAEGLNLVVWIAPVLILIGGFWLVVSKIRTTSSDRPEAEAQLSSPPREELDEYRQRVRDALEKDLET